MHYYFSSSGRGVNGDLFLLIAFLCYNFRLFHTFRVWYIDWDLRWVCFLSRTLIKSDLIIDDLVVSLRYL